MTDPEAVRLDSGCGRTVALYGYVRGSNLKPGMQMHLCGVGDVSMAEVAALPDPCPLPDKVKKRSLDGKERLLYAPMSDVGRLVYDKDAMYINLPDHQVNFTRPSAEDGGDGVDHAVQTPGVGMVRSLQDTQMALDEKLKRGQIRVFGASAGPGGSDEEEEGEDEDDDDGSEWSDEGAHSRWKRAVACTAWGFAVLVCSHTLTVVSR